MKLLVDSGATKANWALTQEGQVVKVAHTQGISPYFLDDQSIGSVLNQVRLDLPSAVPNEIHFYSTGCAAIEQRQRMTSILQRHFPEASVVKVNTDMLAAARALCQHHAGIVGILGTGSNACRYDGEQVAETAGGLGFILGDEGSGAAIGKELIQALLNRELSPELSEQLVEEYHLSRDNILQSVYQLPFPNRFLANFAPFVYQHRQDTFFQEVLKRQFSLFFKRSVLPLSQNGALPVHFVGSVAHYFQAEIETAAALAGLQCGTFQKDPMPGLARYHG